MQGGSYINEGGVLRRVDGTEDHPQGNRARDADGGRLNRPDKDKPVRPASAVGDRPNGRRNHTNNSAPPADAGTEG